MEAHSVEPGFPSQPQRFRCDGGGNNSSTSTSTSSNGGSSTGSSSPCLSRAWCSDCGHPGCTAGELRITIAGADRTEGVTAAATAARFYELARLLAATGCRRARLLLVGPGIPRALAGASFTYDARDLLAPHKCGGGSSGRAEGDRALRDDDGSSGEDEGRSSERRSGRSGGSGGSRRSGRSGSYSRSGSGEDSGSGGDAGAQAQAPRARYPLRVAVARVAAANPHEVGAAEAAAEAAASRALREAATSAQGGEGGVFVLRIAYAPGMFHDQASIPSGAGAVLADLDCERQPPHLVACFNAGVWGYGRSWCDTFTHATRTLRCHVLITSYSMEEAEDDADTMEEGVPGMTYAWEAEENPFRSLRRWGPGSCVAREAAIETTELLLENHWWQCVRPS
ncbi:hypothetical protein FOA52_006547 [Chlamydomonas sp. UWO 241]|nr:hypothetical protein FOA52_006547 [Chlamydomonas sp. UWO 241]